MLTLASSSPRRKALLRFLVDDFETISPDVDETMPTGSPADAILAVAQRKALAVEGDVVLAADTAGVLGTHMLAKATDADGAHAMLGSLIGTTHQVITGVVVRRGNDLFEQAVRTDVSLGAGFANHLDAYIASGEWEGKAGSYGLQDDAIGDWATIDGPWTNVVGLPLAATKELLEKAGLDVRPAPPESMFVAQNPF